VSDDIDFTDPFYQMSAPPSTKTEEEVIELIKANRGLINEVAVMCGFFELTPAKATQARARRAADPNCKSLGLPSAVMDNAVSISDEAAEAIIKKDVGFFVRKFKYKQYVKTSETKGGPPIWMGPFHSPVVTQTIAGKVKPIVSLRRALDESALIFNTKTINTNR
jgi:hypothetical protein